MQNISLPDTKESFCAHEEDITTHLKLRDRVETVSIVSTVHAQA